LLGEDAAGLSPSTISRLCKDCEAERERFRTRSLRFHRYAYLFVDGIHVSLCLCYPMEWDAGQLIARTIIPWASEWLLHFEIFVASGRWHGGGHEPAVPRR